MPLGDRCYILYPSPLSLHNARQACKQLGDNARLVSVRSSEDKQSIIQLISKTHTPVHPEMYFKVWTNAIKNSSHYQWPEEATTINDLSPSNTCNDGCCGLQVLLKEEQLSLVEAACDTASMAICVKPANETHWSSIEFVGRHIDSRLSKQMAILSALETKSLENHVNVTDELTAIREALDVSIREMQSYFAVEASMMMNLSLLINELREESSLRESLAEQVDRSNNLLVSLSKKTSSMETKIDDSKRYLDSKVELVLIILRETKKILSETVNSKVNSFTHSQQGTFYNRYTHCFNYTSSMIIIIFCFFFTLSSLILTVLLFRQLLIIRGIFHFRPILGFQHESPSSRVNDLEMRTRNMQLARD